jgi:hypothetical protein
MLKRVLLLDFGTQNMISSGNHEIFCQKNRDGSFTLQRYTRSVDVPADEPPWEFPGITTTTAFISAFAEITEDRASADEVIAEMRMLDRDFTQDLIREMGLDEDETDAAEEDDDGLFHVYPGMRRPPVAVEAEPDLTQRVITDLATYGATDDENMIAPLRVIYREWMEKSDAEGRMGVLSDFLSAVEEGRLSSNVLLPFVGCDADRAIASTAALSFAMTHPKTADEAMVGVVLLAKGIVGGTMSNPGAVFGGLLNLGDYRVNKVLWPFRNMIKGADLDEAVRIRTGRLSSAVVDFLLDWLEQMDADNREERFNPIAAALVNHRSAAVIPWIAVGGRVWPVAGATPEDEEEAAQYIDLATFTELIMPRLKALRQIAPDPEVVDYVVEAWEAE